MPIHLHWLIQKWIF